MFLSQDIEYSSLCYTLKWKWKSLSHVWLIVTPWYTVHGILQARILEWVAFPFSRDLPNPGVEPRSPTLQVDSLPAESQEKPKNTGVGSLSLGSSRPRNWTRVTCIAGGFFTNWAIREAVQYIKTLVFIHPIYTSLHLLIPNSHSSLPIHPQQLQICSLCLWLCFYLADKFICTIF